jgi:hypothetical protein
MAPFIGHDMAKSRIQGLSGKLGIGTKAGHILQALVTYFVVSKQAWQIVQPTSRSKMDCEYELSLAEDTKLDGIGVGTIQCSRPIR